MAANAAGVLRATMGFVERLGGRYRLISPVGQGGMAEVWRALDERLEREVAVKLLFPHVHPAERARFAREIRALSRLIHPGVVQIYDLGEEAGRLYFVMELVQGGGFDRLGPFEEGVEGWRLLRAAAEVLDALAYLHDQGVIHRDLTPANILITPEGHAKVMDFGLAYLSDVTQGLTRTGYTLGTPQYMAPEQATGGEVGPAVDLYAFGAVLYRALTGEAPFSGEHDQAVLYKHVYEPPTPPSEKNPAVFPGLSRLVLDLLAKKPEARPPSARAAKKRLLRLEKAFASRAYKSARAGAARSGHYPEGPLDPAALELASVADLEGEAAWPSEMALDHGRLALGVGRGGLMVFAAGGLAPVARLSAEDEVTAPPLFADQLYYAAWDGGLYRWSGEGAPRRVLSSQAEITASLLEAAGRVYVPSRDGRLYAVEDGEVSWVFEAEGHLSVGVTLYRGLLFVASEGGWVYALEPRSGRLVYKVETGPIHAHLPATDGVLLLPTWPGEVHGFDPLRREVLWTFDLEGELWASPAVGYGLAFMAGWSGVLYAVDLKSGDEVWHAEVGRVTAGLSLAAGVLYVATEEGALLAFDATSGALHLRLEGLGELQVPPLPTEDGVYVASVDGKLYLFEERT